MSPSLALIASSTAISQGAEAKVYKTYLDSDHRQVPVLLKHRFTKQYRHPSLDTSLTRSRVAGEARALMKCLRSGVSVPGIRMVDATEGVLGIEWIEGKSVRLLLGGGAEDEEEMTDHDCDEEEKQDALEEYKMTIDELMWMIGTEIAKMHQADVIHGDLTSSNMMVRHPSAQRPGWSRLVLIDFGLGYISTLVEDKAVDLYVLERAFGSTHPDAGAMFGRILAGYGKQLGDEEWTGTKTRLDAVRLRGRKRSMVG